MRWRSRSTLPSDWSGNPSGASNVLVSHCGSIAPKKNRRLRRIGPPTVAPASLSCDATVLTVPSMLCTVVVGGFETVRTRVAEGAALEVVRAALGHNVDHAAGRLAELRFVAAGLHLDFLHEVVRRAVAERAEHDRVRSQRAIAAVGDVHAVHDVLVLEAARSSDRRIGDAHTAASADAGRQIERVAEAPPDRQTRQAWCCRGSRRSWCWPCRPSAGAFDLQSFPSACRPASSPASPRSAPGALARRCDQPG